MLKLLSTILALISLTPATVFAVDGVILIDQNKALAGNVTPGDGAGYPVILSLSGSYRLSGNLTVPVSATGIQITADGVSLDLNGFSIIGPGVFPGGGNAINGDNRKRIRVFNGSISGFSTAVDFLGTAELITLEELIVDATTISPTTGPIGGLAMRIGRDNAAGALVRNIAAKGQIQVTCPSVVVNIITGLLGVVEIRVPYDGSGSPFPTKCKGENVF
jgi:hypothetical protein